ncbi:HNH endonuclease domain-containing protein [Candidatus Poribacteria bacterium]
MRFLSPWFAKELSGEPDGRRNALIREYSRKSQESAIPCPYFFREQDDSHICLNRSWVEFLQENRAVIKAFVEYHTVQYLQRRNPNVPNVISKLRAPSRRNLSHARRFWRSVEKEFRMQGKRHWFQDIYSRRELGEEYAIDHFCPWSFVVHDQIWNLVPVAQVVNSSKGNRLPDLDHYIPDMAKLHLRSLRILKQFPVLLEEYVDCYKIDWDSLCQTDEEQFYQKVRDNFIPLFTTAKNQGFETDWRYNE